MWNPMLLQYDELDIPACVASWSFPFITWRPSSQTIALLRVVIMSRTVIVSVQPSITSWRLLPTSPSHSSLLYLLVSPFLQSYPITLSSSLHLSSFFTPHSYVVCRRGVSVPVCLFVCLSVYLPSLSYLSIYSTSSALAIFIVTSLIHLLFFLPHSFFSIHSTSSPHIFNSLSYLLFSLYS